MSAKKGAAKWDDDDDIPLALRVKQAAKPAPQASAPAKSAPASAKKAEDTSGAASPSAADAKKKKDKELRQRIKAKADPIPVLRAANKSAGGGSGPLEWAQKNWKTIAIVVGCLLFFYFKVSRRLPPSGNASPARLPRACCTLRLWVPTHLARPGHLRRCSLWT